MDRFAFATSPFWAELETFVYRPTATDFLRAAATADRDDHDLKKGRMEGADKLWANLVTLRKTWEREEKARGG